MISLDTETHLIAPYQCAPPLVCVSLSCDAGWESLLKWDDPTLPRYLERILRGDYGQIIGHHIAYDMAVICAQFPHLMQLVSEAYDANRITCTEIRQKLLDIAGGIYRRFFNTSGKAVKISYDLASLCQRHLNVTLNKNGWRLRYSELRDIPIEQWPTEAVQYPLNDVRFLKPIYDVQEQGAHYLKDQYRQSTYSFWLVLSSAWGVTTDPRQLHELAVKTRAEVESLRASLVAAGLVRPDGTKDTKKATALCLEAYARKGEPCPTTPTGKPATDETTCKNSGDPILKAYGRFAAVKTVLDSTIPGLNKPILHTRYESLAETGRTTSSEPNLQNMRTLPGVRECLAPRPGYAFVASDFSGLELCTLGQTCIKLLGYSTLADAMNSGRDPHLEIASEILELPYETLNKKTHFMARQTGKVANFGFGGGMGAASLVEYAEASYQVILTIEQARNLKRVWLKKWVEMPEYFRLIDRQTKSDGGIWQVFSDRYRGRTSYTEAANSYFQGLGSDVAKAAGWAITKACYVDTRSPLWGCRMVLFVHDEFVLEVPLPRVHEAGQELERLMIEASKPWLPDVRIKCETVAMLRYSKEAQPTYQNGRLIPV